MKWNDNVQILILIHVIGNNIFRHKGRDSGQYWSTILLIEQGKKTKKIITHAKQCLSFKRTNFEEVKHTCVSET